MASSKELRFFHDNQEIKAFLVEEAPDQNVVCWLCSLPLHGSPFYMTDPPGLFEVHAKCAKECISLPYHSPSDLQYRNISSSSSSPPPYSLKDPSFSSPSPFQNPFSPPPYAPWLPQYPFSQPYTSYPPPPLPPSPPQHPFSPTTYTTYPPPPFNYGFYFDPPLPTHYPRPHLPYYYNNSVPPYGPAPDGPGHPQNDNRGTRRRPMAALFASSALGAFLNVLLGSIIA